MEPSSRGSTTKLKSSFKEEDDKTRKGSEVSGFSTPRPFSYRRSEQLAVSQSSVCAASSVSLGLEKEEGKKHYAPNAGHLVDQRSSLSLTDFFGSSKLLLSSLLSAAAAGRDGMEGKKEELKRRD